MRVNFRLERFLVGWGAVEGQNLGAEWHLGCVKRCAALGRKNRVRKKAAERRDTDKDRTNTRRKFKTKEMLEDSCLLVISP